MKKKLPKHLKKKTYQVQVLPSSIKKLVKHTGARGVSPAIRKAIDIALDSFNGSPELNSKNDQQA